MHIISSVPSVKVSDEDELNNVSDQSDISLGSNDSSIDIQENKDTKTDATEIMLTPMSSYMKYPLPSKTKADSINKLMSNLAKFVSTNKLQPDFSHRFSVIPYSFKEG